MSNSSSNKARAIGLPLEKMFVNERSSNEEYIERLKGHLLDYKARGVTHFAFGDIRKEDRFIVATSDLKLAFNSGS